MVQFRGSTRVTARAIAPADKARGRARLPRRSTSRRRRHPRRLTMKRLVATIVMAVVVAALGASISAREVQTITGQVIDLNGYLRKSQAEGETAKDVAVAAAKRGEPVAILTADGFYVVKGDWTKNKNEKLVEWMTQKVQATGEVRELNGKKFIELTDVKAAR
jgi:hypothetical protein